MSLIEVHLDIGEGHQAGGVLVAEGAKNVSAADQQEDAVIGSQQKRTGTRL